jgi:hypothetical protein
MHRLHVIWLYQELQSLSAIDDFMHVSIATTQDALLLRVPLHSAELGSTGISFSRSLELVVDPASFRMFFEGFPGALWDLDNERRIPLAPVRVNQFMTRALQGAAICICAVVAVGRATCRGTKWTIGLHAHGPRQSVILILPTLSMLSPH